MPTDSGDGGLCLKCPPGSADCIDQNVATACQGGHLTNTTGTFTCASECPPGQYGIANPNGVGGVCKDCNRTCVSCKDKDICFACKAGFFLDGVSGSCVEACPEGFYEVPGVPPESYGTCVPCDPTSARCTATESLGCKRSVAVTLPSGSCAEECPDGSFENSDGICVPCHAGCSQCDSSSACSQCESPLHLLPNGSCVASCPAGYFTATSTEGETTCRACPDDFAECRNENVAARCNHELYLTAGATCEATCPPGNVGAVRDGRGPTCAPLQCPDDCKKCSDESTCLECKNSKFLTASGLCESICPPPYFGHGDADTGNVCLECDKSCGTCTTDPMECTSCFDDSFLLAKTCVSHCPWQTHFESLTEKGGVCELCTNDCEVCENNEICNRCMNSKYLTDAYKCVSNCPAGTYPHGSGVIGRTCEPCPESCAECDSYDQCTACVPPRHLHHGVCQLRSPAGFFPSPDVQAPESVPLQRPDEVLTAVQVFGGEDPAVAAQVAGAFAACMAEKRGKPASVIAAEAGVMARGAARAGGISWPNTAAAAAEAAGHAAKFEAKAAGKSETEIVAAAMLEAKLAAAAAGMTEEEAANAGSKAADAEIPDYLFSDKKGSCIPKTAVQPITVSPPAGNLPEGFLQCPSTCAECRSETVCTACKDSLYLDLAGACVANCGLRHYGNAPAGGTWTCERCTADCRECKTGSECEVCENTKYLSLADQTCVAECPTGSYAKPGQDTVVGGVCYNCPLDCVACDSEDFCTECKLGRHLTAAGSCVETCPAGFYTSSPDEPCMPCGGKCNICDAAGSCLQCKDNAYLGHHGTCISIAPRGYYGVAGQDGIGGTVAPCPETCSKCQSETLCTECKHGSFLKTDGTCDIECPIGYYEAKEPALGCPAGGLCKPCEDDCNICTKDDLCLQCQSGFFLGPDGKCHGSCPAYYFEVAGTGGGPGGTCHRCLEGCRHCTDATTCLDCLSGTVLTPGGTCESCCPVAFYADDSNKCQSCPAHCDQCEKPPVPCGTTVEPDLSDSAVVCKHCTDDYYLAPDGRCVDVASCPAGSYANENSHVCEVCSVGCTRCLSGGICAECGAGKYLTPAETCEDVCPPGFYTSSEGNVCEVCRHNCNLCNSEFSCTQCKNHKFLNPTAECLDDCPSGFYKNVGAGAFSGTCMVCPPGCKTCLSESVCTECTAGSYLTTLNTCAASCPPGFVANAETRECEVCPKACNACNSKDVCTQCKQHHFLNPTGKCQESCPKGTYGSEGNGCGSGIGGTCKACPHHCIACEGKDHCTECGDSKYLTPVGTCSNTCPPGFYQNDLGRNGSTCEICGSGCNLCLSDCVCTQCKNSLYLGPLGVCSQTCPRGFHIVPPGPTGTGGLCKACPRHCAACADNGSCLECEQGYTFDAARGACVREKHPCPT